MAKQGDPDVIHRVKARIDEAISKNRATLRIYVVLLVGLFTVGLGLMVFGAVTQELVLLAPGSIVQLATYLPLRKLIQVREDDMRLQIIPQLLELADTKQAKVLAAKLVDRLIEKL